jgi:ATP-dependent DNA helicase RecG
LAHQRLEAIVETNDGFKLSEMDLELRGEGDVLGENQSGMRSQLKMLKVTLDGELIQHARELAEEIIKKPISKDLLRGVELMQPDALAAS